MCMRQHCHPVVQLSNYSVSFSGRSVGKEVGDMDGPETAEQTHNCP